jgi:hypothetical protein
VPKIETVSVLISSLALFSFFITSQTIYHFMSTRRQLTDNMARLILNPKKPGDRAIKGIIFDMDGTLCKPQVSFFFFFFPVLNLKFMH